MKRALTALFALTMLAVPLAADEPKKESAPAPQQDSALVAAAKRTHRLGKKPTNVITNETLKKSGTNAHVTTTDTQAKIKMPAPPKPTPEMIAATEKAQKKIYETSAEQEKQK